MTAPTRVAQWNSTVSTTVTSGTLTGVPGDLVVVCVHLEVDGSPVATLYDGASPIGTATLDLHTTDGTRGLHIFSRILTATPTNLTVQMSSWPGSGTRRFSVMVFRPASGEIVPAWGAARLVRATDPAAATGADGWTFDGSAVGHTDLTSTVSNRGRAAVGVVMTRGGTAALTGGDFNADGTADSTGTIYDTANGSNLVQGFYRLFDTGAAPISSGTKVQVLGSQGANVTVCACVLYVLERQVQGRAQAAAAGAGLKLHPFKIRQGRAQAAAYASAKFFGGAAAPILREGRANSVAWAGGAGRLMNSRRQGRARAVASAFARFVHTIKAQGRSTSAADAHAYFFRQPAQPYGYAAGVASASARYKVTFRRKGYAAVVGWAGVQAHVTRKAEGRAQAVAHAFGMPFRRITAQGRATSAASATSVGYTITKKRTGYAAAVAWAGARPLHGALREGRAVAVASATATYYFRPRTDWRVDGRANAAASAASAGFVLLRQSNDHRTRTRKLSGQLETTKVSGQLTTAASGTGRTSTAIREDIQ